MTNDEKLRVLEQWQEAIQKSDALINPVIGVLELDPTSPICDAVWRLQDALTESVEREIGDRAHWLKWYEHDNDFGQKALEAGFPGNKRKICTLSDLIWLMEGCND